MAEGFQFAHIENFSRKGDKRGRTVGFVLGEARRDAAASLHVSSPRPPELVWGASLDEVEREHDARAVSARKAVAGGKERAVGREQHTLLTVVVSHPYTVAEVEADPAKRAEVERWEDLNVRWLRDQFGADLRTVVRHTDEKYWHLHGYGVPGDPEMRAWMSHPGQVAKREVVAAGPAEGEDDKAMHRRSDRAYKGAMRDWQNAYFESVGVPAGLTRIGPGRRRLPRAEWHQERDQAQALRLAQEKADALRATVQQQAREFVSKTKGQGGELLASARAEAERVRAEAAQLRADAARRADAALAAVDAAQAAEARAREAAEKAQQERREAELATTAARRLSGLGGALRGLWDGLRHSKVAARIRAELMPAVEQWQKVAAEARARETASNSQRQALAATVKELRRSAGDLGAQRDELRERLAAYEPATPEFAPAALRPHP
ncbi:plasmid recombination protein [Rhizobium leguminosarum]|uniref:plasmid recombination protein n=1 Tax=Rhizobium leguminosarum TaxID=384 RepID=UPI001C9216A0|nr:plasmid recombination protein [Rhizobium leguminosarum]MBY2975522.1 hypothetical protein [Rhizobium leguminosarum]